MAKNRKLYSRREVMGTVAAGIFSVLLLASNNEYSRAQTSVAENISNSKPRNIVFILSDDHRYDFMGFMNKPKFLETPNMDRLANEGVHFVNTFVTTALCSPSRASILTGQYSHRHGVVDNQTDIREGTVFFPQYLQSQGYQTAFFGKWHMGDYNPEPRPGFDKWVSFPGQGQYYDGELNIDGEKVQSKGYMTDTLTDFAVDWLENDWDRDKPFFIYLSHKAVHAMFEPAKRHLGKYDNVPLEYPKSMADTQENYKDKPEWVKAQRNSWHGVDYMYHGSMDFDTFYRRYCETLLGVDDSIGSIMKTLEKLGIDKSTMLMYMGDNGFSFGEHGLIDKRHMYEESMRVPFLAYCPELINPGTKIKGMIQNIDIAPTVLELAGLTAPEAMDGQSFIPLLMKKETKWRDAVFYEYYWEWNFPQTPTVHGIRTDRYKYIHYHGIWDRDELYDLQNDPDEMTNLINNPEHQDLIQKLKMRVFDWLEKTDGMQIPMRAPTGFRGADRKSVD